MSAATAEAGEEDAAAAPSPSPPLRLSSSCSSSFLSAGGCTVALPEETGEPRMRAAGGEEEEEEEESVALLAPCPVPQAGEEMKEVEECIEEMLIRLDEFCGMTDMIRSDTSQILDEAIPLIKAKVIEMSSIYTKVDKLEAFVKMAGHHVSFLEEQVLQAEKAHAFFPYTIQKLLGSLAIPSFKKKCTPASQYTYNLPELYRTEDYFPIKYIGSTYQSH